MKLHCKHVYMVSEANLPGINWKCLHIKARDTEMLTAFITTQEITQNFYMYSSSTSARPKIQGSYFN